MKKVFLLLSLAVITLVAAGCSRKGTGTAMQQLKFIILLAVLASLTMGCVGKNKSADNVAAQDTVTIVTTMAADTATTDTTTICKIKPLTPADMTDVRANELFGKVKSFKYKTKEDPLLSDNYYAEFDTTGNYIQCCDDSIITVSFGNNSKTKIIKADPFFGDDDGVYKYFYIFDNYGRIAYKTIDAYVYDSTEYFYSEQNSFPDSIKLTVNNHQGDMPTYTFVYQYLKFDENGNWTKRKTIRSKRQRAEYYDENGDPVIKEWNLDPETFIETAIITYY
jgi:hypothetical protein